MATAAVAAACVVAAAAVLLSHPSPHADRLVLAMVTCGAVLMFAISAVAARSAARRVAGQVREARLAAQRGQAELERAADMLLRGEQPAPPVPARARAADGDLFSQLMSEVEQSRYHAGQVLARVADKTAGNRLDQRVEIFVNLARRMQSLVHREIEMLDDLEGKVEDPDLLKGLFTVDHLATRMRRQSESLAVLGGSMSRRQWTRQVTMHEVLRAAVAEVEQYSRVKIVPPVEGVLRGTAVTDVIHLVAELVENATKFSAPQTTALVRAQHVAAGVVIEIEDRGLGILPADQQRMNGLLADPARMNVDELLRDGRIGLYVVAMLARRHGIQVRLQNNIYGGTQAVAVLPAQILDEPEQPQVLSRPDRGNPDYTGPDRTEPDRGHEAGRGPALARAGGGPVSGGPAGGRGAESTGLPQPQAPAHLLSPGLSGPPPVHPGASGQSLGAAAEGRPPLPKRQAGPDHRQPGGQRDEPRQVSPDPGGEPPADQMSGLMADFLRGTRRATEEGSPARD